MTTQRDSCLFLCLLCLCISVRLCGPPITCKQQKNVDGCFFFFFFSFVPWWTCGLFWNRITRTSSRMLRILLKPVFYFLKVQRHPLNVGFSSFDRLSHGSWRSAKLVGMIRSELFQLPNGKDKNNNWIDKMMTQSSRLRQQNLPLFWFDKLFFENKTESDANRAKCLPRSLRVECWNRPRWSQRCGPSRTKSGNFTEKKKEKKI